jgi:hypothetical protein
MVRDRIPRCELGIVPGAGHACQIEQPSVFNALVMGFLQKHRLATTQRVAAGLARATRAEG